MMTKTLAGSTSDRMPRKRSYLLAPAALACIVVQSALAEPALHATNLYRHADMSRYVDNFVELGVGYSRNDSYKFGEWTGLREEGAYPIVGFNWLSRQRDNDASHWQLHASGLGLETRKFRGELGTQGRWHTYVGADRLVRSEIDSARFIFGGLGTSLLTLPAGFPVNGIVGQPPLASSTTAVLPFLHGFQIEQGRDIYRFGASMFAGANWNMRLDYREDVRDGTRLTGATFGVTGGNPRSVVVPYEIDDHTQQLDLSLEFADAGSQAQLAYHFSRYENRLAGFRWQNPYDRVGGWPVAPNGADDGTFGQLSLQPSNDFHQLTVTGSHRFAPNLRLTSKLSYGVGTQNDALLPYTINPAVTVTSALPRTSLDGKVVSSLADIALNWRPTGRSNLKLGYQFAERDNQTPMTTYRYVVLDTANQPTVDSNAIRQNVPISTSESRLLIDGDITVLARTQLRGVWEYRDIDYTNADITSAAENKATIEIRQPIADGLSGATSLSYKQRRADNYNKNTYYTVSYPDPANAGGTAPFFDNNPQMRQFTYGDHDESRARASGNWIASETVTLQGGIEGFLNEAKDKGCANVAAIDARVAAAALTWVEDCLGRQKLLGATVSLDGQWQPEVNLTAFAFYTYSDYRTEQRNRTFNTAATSDDIANDFTVDMAFRDHTAGIGAKWQPVETIDTGVQYVFSSSKGSTDIVRANGAAVTPVPDNRTRLHAAQIYAKWNASRKVTWRINYLYEYLDTSDWAYDKATEISSNNVLLTGQDSPRYINHVVGVSVALHSW